MKISNASLHALLASAAAFTGVAEGAFAYTSTSIRHPLAHLHSSLPSISTRATASTSTSTSTTRTTSSRSKSTIMFAEKEKGGEEDKQPGNALDGVDDVAAEAQAALQEAQKALDLLNPKSNTNSNSTTDTNQNQLIDVDELATDSETLSIMEKLASGKLSSQDVTSKLIEKQTNLQDQKRQEEIVRQETQKQLLAKQTLEEQEKRKGEAVNASVGGAAFGALAGIALDVFLDMKGVTEIEPIVPPFFLGASFTAAAFVVGQQDNAIGKAVRDVLGGTVQSLSKSISSSVMSAVDNAVKEVKATPVKIKTAVDAKVKETTDEIKQIPGKVKDSATKRSEEIGNDLRQIPGKVKDSAQRSADNTKEKIENATKKAVEDVRAAPGRVADETKKSFVSAKKDVEEKIERSIKSTEKKITDTVDEVAALPGKLSDKISGGVSKVIPMEKKEPTPDNSTAATSTSDRVPKPPEMPPPESMLNELEKKFVAKPPPPKQAAEAANTSPPSLPKITIPKINMPKLGQEKPVPAKKEKKADDNFVFSEVSLKNLAAKDKKDKPPAPVDDDDSDRPNIFDIMKQRTSEADTSQKQKDDQLSAAIKLKQAAEAKNNAAEERIIQAEMRKQVQQEAVAEKNRLAEERRLEAKRIADETKAKADKMRNQAEEKRAAEVRLQRAKPGATISLGFFGIGGQQDDKGDDKSVQPATLAPKGVPTMTKWKQNRDGSITGLISGSNAFTNGESITTSPITTKDPSVESVVTTDSGSRYYLDENLAPAGFFDWISTPKPETKSKPNEDPLAKARKNAEERKVSAQAAAEARKLQVEERRDAADAKRREAEEKRQASIAARKEAEAKRQAEKLLAKSSGGTLSLGANIQKKQQAQSAENAISKAKPGATISLGSLFGRNKDEESSTKSTSTAAPRGVPTITRWRQNRDGSVSGFVSGSNAYKDGESITTSPLKTKSPEGESVVSTISGSKYFLDAISPTPSFGGLFGSSAAKVAPSPAPKSVPQPDTNTKMQQLAEERKAAAEARKIEAAEKREAALEAAEAKNQEAAEKRALLVQNKAPVSKVKQSAEVVKKARSGATISLGFLNFGSDDKNEDTDSAKSGKGESQVVSQAPRGVPTITSWRQNRDGSISGKISGSSAFSDGEAVTTSPITSDAVDGGLVKTTSGSKYFLAPKAQFGGFFGGGSGAYAGEIKKVEAEDKRKAAAAAAEERKREADEKRKAAVAAADARKSEADGKRKAALAAAEAKKQEAAQKRKAAQDAATARTKAQQSEEVVAKATPRATVSLGFLNFGQKNEDTSSPSAPSTDAKKPSTKMASAPRGVPTLYTWRQNRDDSVTGLIAGSNSYSDGESVTTSPLSTDTAFGSLVQTASGSKYYLAAKGAKLPKAESTAPANTRTFSLGKPVPESPTKPVARTTFSLGKPTRTSTPEPSAAPESFFGGSSPSTSKPKAKKPAPRGVPTIAKWRTNRDGSITGIISGSPGYDDGDRVTTSAIASGTVEAGEVVQTGSGSKYYLD